MFLSILFYLSSSLREDLKVSGKYPIDRGFCKVNLDGYQYSFLNFGDRRIDIKDDPNGNYTYYFRYCKELQTSDLMDGAIVGDLKDVFSVRCHKTTKKCDALITENAWDWTFYDFTNKSAGITYYAIGEPVKVSDISYFTLDVRFDVACDPTQTDFDVSPKVIFDILEEDEASIRIIVSSSYGCGQKVDVPTPTPNPFKPNCQYTDRYDPNMNYSIDIDLSDMNGGPYGIRSHNVPMNGKNYTLFYQPCERMKCPPSYKCPSSTWSSAWVCDITTLECTSYGVIEHEGKYITPLDDILDGVEINFKENDKSMTLQLGCDRFLPMDHFDFASTMTLDDNNHITMRAKAQNACLIPFPDPTPAANKCYFQNKNTYQDSTITLNMTSYDKGDMVGWKTDVTYQKGGKTVNGVLYYEPCDNIFCPKDAFCEGDEDATVYLCAPDEDDSSKLDCDGYGLLENAIDMFFMSNYDITEGVKVDYYADIGRTAVVNWRCDSSLDDKTLRLPSTVNLYKKELSFEVYAKAACGSNNPQPRPPWHPPAPTVPAEPTPTPQPSVNPVDIYVINETHYILTPLNNYQQDVYKGDMTIVFQGIQSTIYAEFHPWKFIPCPSGYRCSANAADSNFWACWVEDDYSKYCHSVGDVRILNDMKPLSTANPDEGAELIFGGVYGFNTHFDIDCDLQASNESIDFDRATVLAYQLTKDGPILKAFLDSGAVCPREFEPIPTPVPQARQTPEPGYKPSYTYRYDQRDGSYLSIDLGQIEMHDEVINMGLFPHYQRNLFRYYPKNPGAPPSGFQVLDTDVTTANLWRCFNSTSGNYCHSCGDSRINLIYQLVQDDDIKGGLSINYEGGYGGFETHIQLICNESIKGNKVDFDDVGRYHASTKAPVIFAHTSMICPKYLTPTPKPTQTRRPTATPKPTSGPEPDGERNGITGGSVFLFMVIAGFVLYLLIGVMVGFIRNGMLAFPNEDFWVGFAECVETAVIFIFTCGKKGGRMGGDAFLYDKAPE